MFKLLALSGHHVRMTAFAVSFLLLTGCSTFNSGWNRTPRYYDSYAQSDFEELLDFGNNMAQLPHSSRTKICRALLKSQKGPRATGILLHMMIGRLLSDSCGDIPRILSGIRAIPSRNLGDPRIQKLISIHTEALKRMNTMPMKYRSQQYNQRPDQPEDEPKAAKGSKKNETRILREKLEAIRTMEKQMDESGEPN
jgi:hypothetical protein